MVKFMQVKANGNVIPFDAKKFESGKYLPYNPVPAPSPAKVAADAAAKAAAEAAAAAEPAPGDAAPAGGKSKKT